MAGPKVAMLRPSLSKKYMYMYVCAQKAMYGH